MDGSSWGICSGVNPQGCFDFIDRSKYMIKSGGENIYPAEIERVLLADQRIGDAVVMRKSDPKWGEVPVAFIAGTDDSLTEEEVVSLCRTTWRATNAIVRCVL